MRIDIRKSRRITNGDAWFVAAPCAHVFQFFASWREAFDFYLRGCR